MFWLSIATMFSLMCPTSPQLPLGDKDMGRTTVVAGERLRRESKSKPCAQRLGGWTGRSSMQHHSRVATNRTDHIGVRRASHQGEVLASEVFLQARQESSSCFFRTEAQAGSRRSATSVHCTRSILDSPQKTVGSEALFTPRRTKPTHYLGPLCDPRRCRCDSKCYVHNQGWREAQPRLAKFAIMSFACEDQCGDSSMVAPVSDPDGVGAAVEADDELAEPARIVSTCTRSSFDNMRAFVCRRLLRFVQFLNGFATSRRCSLSFFCSSFRAVICCVNDCSGAGPAAAAVPFPANPFAVTTARLTAAAVCSPSPGVAAAAVEAAAEEPGPRSMSTDWLHSLANPEVAGQSHLEPGSALDRQSSIGILSSRVASRLLHCQAQPRATTCDETGHQS